MTHPRDKLGTKYEFQTAPWAIILIAFSPFIALAALFGLWWILD